ncbi:tyrosine-type recombinase/integrase [Nitratifractor sp.]
MKKTKIAGVYQRVGKKDTTYYIRYRVGDRVETEKVGKKSEGMTVDKAYEILKKRRSANPFDKVKQVKKARKVAPTFQNLAQKYFEKCRALAEEERLLSKTEKTAKTLKNIKREESIFRNFWQGWQFRTIPLDRIKQEHVKAYLLAQREKYSEKSIYNALTLAKSILKHTKELYDGTNPFVFEDEVNKKRFSKPKDNARKKFLTEEQCELLLDHLQKNSTHQNYTIVLASLTTGARPDTVLNIKIEDVDYQRREIRLYDFKRKMYYKARLTGELAKAIKKQAGSRSKKEYLFFSESSKGKKQLAEYPRSIKRVLDKLFNESLEEGEERITPYTFRHTFANLLLQVYKMPIFEVSQLLNHASVQTTIENYVSFDHESVASQLDVFEKALTGSTPLNEKQLKADKILDRIQNGVSAEEFSQLKNQILSLLS